MFGRFITIITSPDTRSGIILALYTGPYISLFIGLFIGLSFGPHPTITEAITTQAFTTQGITIVETTDPV